jgi:hypothetical protein
MSKATPTVEAGGVVTCRQCDQPFPPAGVDMNVEQVQLP